MSNALARTLSLHLPHRPPAEPLTPPPPRAISQKQWSATELDLDSLDLDEELAKLEQREIQPTKAFGQERASREDTLSARRDQPEAEEEHWPDSLFSQPPAAATTSTKNPSRSPSTPAGPGVPNRRCPSTWTIWKTNPRRPPCSRTTTWSPCQRTVP